MHGTVIRQRAEQLAATLPPLLVAAERVAATVAQGVHGRRRVGVGETFWQFRRYQPGDTASRIDWRQSAKSQRIFVREHEWEAAQSVWLWRDASPSMRYASDPAGSDKLQRANLLLLAIAALLVRGGEFVGLLGSDRTPTPGRATLTRLATLIERPAEDGGVPPTARLPRYARLVLFGDFLAPLDDVAATVRLYASRGIDGHLVQIVDPAEEDLPFSGRVRFHGLEGEESYTANRVESLRGDYLARFRARREELSDIARAVGWTLVTHRTDRPPQAALLTLYQSLAEDLR
jgi:uncharacterized protein (DUF58 family)